MNSNEQQEQLELTSSNVRTILDECFLRNEHEIPEDKIILVEGIRNTFGFHPDRVQSNKQAIKSLLSQLNPKFKDGWTFLNIPLTSNGVQWGEHQNAEQLVVLGIAARYIEELPSKRLSAVFPGGMPYVTIRREVFNEEPNTIEANNA